MRPRMHCLPAIVVAFAAGPATAETEIESFDGGVFSNPFFVHDLEFDDPCCWEITNCDNLAGPTCDLHLRPNTDFITFDLAKGFEVLAVSVMIRDFEGGFVGDSPTSVVIVRASSGDFVAGHAAEIAVPEVLSFDVDDVGQLFGEPLGDITTIQLQAANEGNSVVPGFGAFYDEITVELGRIGDLDGDGVVGILDFLALLAAWGPCPEPCPPSCPADLDGDCVVGILDFLALLASWGS